MSYVNSIVGWQFPEKTILKYLPNKKKPLLTMDFDFPCKKNCNLKCKYCFIQEDSREKDALLNKTKKIEVEHLKKVFIEAKKLGLQSIKLVGDQEPFLENDFLDFIEFTNKMNIWVVIFTNGLVLANEKQCRRIHNNMSSEDIIDFLRNRKVSIMLKFHSFSNKVEDDLVKYSGYAEKRNNVLKKFISAGLNDLSNYPYKEHFSEMVDNPEHWTRLGLESVITPQCLDDIDKIYEKKVTDNLFVDLDPPVAVGLTRNKEMREKLGLSIEPDIVLEICKRLYAKNIKYGIPYKGPSPYMGDLPCTQLPYGLYVNSIGHLYPCCGCPEFSGGKSQFLGDISGKNSNDIIITLKEAILSNPYKKNILEQHFAYDKYPFNKPKVNDYEIYHGCPFRDNEGNILPKEWMRKVDDYVKSLF